MCEPDPKTPNFIRNECALKVLSLKEGFAVFVGCNKYKVPFGVLLELLADFQYRSTIDEEYLKARYAVYQAKK
jgi:hypothetical protein